MHLPLPRGLVARVEVTTLELGKPQLDGGCCVAIWGRKDDLEAQVLVASTALLALVIGGLDKSC